MDVNVIFCQQMLRGIRQEAAAVKVKIPKRLTAMRVSSGSGNWWLVEGEGFRQEVTAHNAYDAKYQVITKILEHHQRAADTRGR